MAGAVKRYCVYRSKQCTFASEMARVLTKMTTERYCLGSPARPDCNELLVQILERDDPRSGASPAARTTSGTIPPAKSRNTAGASGPYRSQRPDTRMAADRTAARKSVASNSPITHPTP